MSPAAIPIVADPPLTAGAVASVAAGVALDVLHAAINVASRATTPLNLILRCPPGPITVLTFPPPLM
jgi:hypothetical protein